jgi:polar amino acid transport system substrate-binding protein
MRFPKALLKPVAAATALLASSLLCSANAASLSAYQGKTLNVAVNAVYPPMEYHDLASGQLIGFDIDLGNALAAQLGATLAWQESSFAQLMPSLTSERADLILSGLNDRPDRRAVADFVDYLNSGAQLFVLAPRAASFPDASSLCGKTVAISRSTSFVSSTKAWSDAQCVQHGKPAVVIEGTDDSAAARLSLKQQRVDAAVQGTETIPYAMKLEPNVYRTVGSPFAIATQGIGFRKADTALRDAFAHALGELMANGTYAKIVAKWQLQNSAATAVTLNDGAVSK